MKVHGPWASAWVGESGGAYNSGGREVSNTFVDSFWLDWFPLYSVIQFCFYMIGRIVKFYLCLIHKFLGT